MTYAVGGYMEGGFGGVAPAVKGVLAGRMGRLRRYVEIGEAAARPDSATGERARVHGARERSMTGLR